VGSLLEGDVSFLSIPRHYFAYAHLRPVTAQLLTHFQGNHIGICERGNQMLKHALVFSLSCILEQFSSEKTI